MRLLLNFLVRALFGVVILGILFGIGYIGGWPFFVVIALMTVFALREYYSALRLKQIRPNCQAMMAVRLAHSYHCPVQ